MKEYRITTNGITENKVLGTYSQLSEMERGAADKIEVREVGEWEVIKDRNRATDAMLRIERIMEEWKNIRITPEKAVLRVKAILADQMKCPSCNGEGERSYGGNKNVYEMCARCDGTGYS